MRFITARYRGFTFVEVLVAVAIVAILATIATFSYQDAKKKGRDTERVSDVLQLQLALRNYLEGSDSYPAGSGIVIGTGGSLDTLLSPYLPSIPKDPLGGSYQYTYENSYTCGGSAHTIIHVSMERSGASNWSSVCGGIDPGSNSYVVILR